jgi:hypothetical protein
MTIWPPSPLDGKAPPILASFRRLDTGNAENLSKQLGQIPELNLDDTGEAIKKLVSEAQAEFRSGRTPLHFPDVPNAQSERWQKLGLPAKTGISDALAAPEAAKTLGKLSRDVRLRRLIATPDREGKMQPALVSALVRLLADAVRQNDDGKTIECLPALWQMLQAEDEASRTVLVQYLSRLNQASASIPLAQRALYETSPEIRHLAVAELKKRPPEQYRQVLLDGFRYPWPPVAQHAAEALVELEDSEAGPALAKLLEQPDPAAPFLPADPKQKPQVRELVRVNHLKNCLMCHAPSFADRDTVPGRVPVAGKKLELVYYSGPRRSEDIFVRADITYIRQDFSACQKVENPGAWPEVQRFDYLVRTREATAEEIAAQQKKPANASYPQRDAVLWAIEGLAAKAPPPKAP